MKNTRILSLILCLLLLPVSAFAETVTASFFPIYLFASNLLSGVEGITLHSLASPDTGCLHDYQLSSGDLKALSSSDLFLINGAGMESFLSSVFEAFPDLPLVDASEGIELLPSESGETEFNAHIWLTPDNAVRMSENLARGLIKAFPDKEAAIQANLDNWTERLHALDLELEEGLKDLKRRDLLTFHEAFPYFAQRYGLQVLAVIAKEPDDALSTGELARLVSLVQKNNLPPLFTEPQYPALAAEVLSRETGAPLYKLDPCVTPPEGELPPDWYETVMRSNLSVLREALN